MALAREGHKELVAIQGYTILYELGRGGMGAVSLARHDKTGAQIALKVMLPQVAVDAHAREDFLRETENTRALKHPHVVHLYDAGCSNGTFFFTVEYCAGGSVADLMEQRGETLSIDDASTITLQALEGLHYAHNADVPCIKLADGRIGRGRGLVHRDIKPSNIFLSGSGRARMAGAHPLVL
jgi:eukaryotic-like serine/threonine-protein kinase